jgi:hypothetical protein
MIFVATLTHPKLFVTVYVTVIDPAETPVKTPVEEILASAELLVDHTPPLAKFVKLMEEPTQTPEFPPIIVPAEGTGFMVTSAILDV